MKFTVQCYLSSLSDAVAPPEHVLHPVEGILRSHLQNICTLAWGWAQVQAGTIASTSAFERVSQGQEEYWQSHCHH